MKIRAFLIAVVMTTLIGCGSTGGTKFDVSFNGSSVPLNVTSSGVYPSTKTFSFTKDGETTMTKAVNHYIALSNFELETRGPVTMGKPLTGDGNVRVVFQIVGDEGTDEKDAVKVGSYATKCEKYNCVDYLQISRFTGGKEEKISIDVRKAEGEVKIASVSEDTVTGEIDVKEGANSVKGGFTAKITTKR